MAWIRACGGGSPAVPNGKTVTPINDVTIWQQCAGIANPTYTTLAEVLTDTGILQTLMASNNAVDYMVRSKAFINSINIVPTMTSDTTPIGVASMPSVVSGYPAYYAFDGDDNTRCATGVAYGGVTYKFQTPQCVKRAYAILTIGIASHNIKFEASNDGSTWTTLYTGTWDNTGTFFDLSSNNNSYSYYRFSTTDNWQLSVSTLEYYLLHGVCDNANVMNYIGQNNYASNTLLGDSDWCSAICNSPYFESVLNVKVPVMTSATTPSGTVSASTYQSSCEPYKAFDGNDSSYWASNGSVPQYIEYDFGHDVLIAKMEYLGYATGNTINGYEVTGFDSDNIDHLLISGNMQNVGTMQSVNIFTNSAKYRKYRLKATSTYGNTNPNAKTIQFYGREDV